MELVDKPGCKSAMWKHFGLKCDEEKWPVIDDMHVNDSVKTR